MQTRHENQEPQIGQVALLFNDLETIAPITQAYLTEPCPIASGRHQIKGYTGLYEGKRLALVAIGLGMPSAAFYTQELLLNTEVKAIIRVGLAHGLNDAVQTHELVVAQAACVDCCTYMGLDRLPGALTSVADFGLLRTADDLARKRGILYQPGCIVSVDDTQITHQMVTGRQLPGAIALDMETAAIYAVAARLQRRALSLNLAARRLTDFNEFALEDISRPGKLLLQLALGVALTAATELEEATTNA